MEQNDELCNENPYIEIKCIIYNLLLQRSSRPFKISLFAILFFLCRATFFFACYNRIFRFKCGKAYFNAGELRLALALKYVPHVIRTIFFIHCIPKVSQSRCRFACGKLIFRILKILLH